MKIQTITRPHNFVNVSSDFILKICRAKKSRINIALSGGTTPREIYQSLAKKLDFMLAATNSKFPEIHFYQVDERYVPATDEDSNQKMINEAFHSQKTARHISNSTTVTASTMAKSSANTVTGHTLSAAAALTSTSLLSPHLTFHFFDTSLSIEKSLKKYAAALPKFFDLTILGIGPDGHTASLFPHSKALNSRASVAHTTTESTTQSPVAHTTMNRLTLTFRTILKSKNLLILLKGQEKSPIIEKLKTHANTKNRKITPTQITDFPALKLLQNNTIRIHYLRQE